MALVSTNPEFEDYPEFGFTPEAPAPAAAPVAPNLLDPGFNLTLRPMRYPQFYDMYRDAIRNTWTVESHGPRQTLLRTEASVQLRAGRLGDLAAPMVRWQSRRMGWRALAAFKHLVETGGAPMVAHALLDRPPALC